MPTTATIWRRIIRGLLAFLLVLIGFLWLGQQERMLWNSAPRDTLDRYALDRLLPLLPARVDAATLWQLCDGRPWISHFWQSRRALADCLDQEPVASESPSDSLQSVATVWRESIQAQLAVADNIANLTPAEALSELTALRKIRYRLQDESGGPLLRWLDKINILKRAPVIPEDQFLPVEEDAAAILQSLRSSREYTATRLIEIERTLAMAKDAGDRFRSLRDLGLHASGLLLDHDNAKLVPVAVLRSARASLGEQLEWLRRAQPRASEPLERTLFGYLPMMFTSTLLIVTLAACLGCFPLAAATMMLLATVGGLQLLDLSVTGSTVLRHLATRDFSEGLWRWELPGTRIAFWGPALVFGASLIMGQAVARSSRIAAWVGSFVRIPVGWHALGIVLTTVALVILVPGMAALKAELIVLLGSIPIALFIARHAPLIAQGASEWSLAGYTAPLLIAAFFASFLGSGFRGDLGAFGIAFIVAALFAALIANGWTLRLILLGGLIAGGTWYMHFMKTGTDLTGLVQLFPAHGQLRFLLVQDATHHGAPDLKQVEWFIRHAGSGYGPGQVPWMGLPGNGNVYGLPLPAASDLSLVLPAAMGGFQRAFLEFGLLSAVLVLAIGHGYGRATGQEVRIGERFLAALGAFVLLVVLLRALLSAGGTLQVIPLTGVPIALLSHAPTTAMMTLAYAGLVFGICGKTRTRNELLEAMKS